MRVIERCCDRAGYGDLRLLYLGWLLSVQWADDFDEDDEDPVEPPVPAGLAELSPSLLAIAEFLGIYEDLIAVAAKASPPLREPEHDRLAGWIAALPVAEKDTLLTMAASGEGARVQALLLRRFHEADSGATIRSGASRTASELLNAAGDRVEERERVEELRRSEEQARRTAAEAAAYAARLDRLADAGEAPWEQVEAMIATKKTSEYDQAVALLRDLRALGQGRGEGAAFAARVRELRARYPGRPGLQGRLDKAGLPRL